MNFKSSCILLSSQDVKIINEDDGSIVEGVSARYVMTDNLEPIIDKDTGFKGHRVSKFWVKPEMAVKIQSVPAMYEVSFKSVVNSKGDNVLKVKDLEYLADIKIDIC